jgi:hypothetical protein
MAPGPPQGLTMILSSYTNELRVDLARLASVLTESGEQPISLKGDCRIPSIAGK